MDKQLYNEADKSSNPKTQKLFQEALILEKEYKKLAKNLDDGNRENYFKDIEKQEASLRGIIKKMEKAIDEHIANRAKQNEDLASLWRETQSLKSEEQKQKELNLHYSKEIEKLKISINNRNDEKKRIDNIIFTYNNYIALIDEKRKKLDLFGSEVVEASELKSDNKSLCDAINKVEKAIKEIWNLVNKDKFDEYLHRR